MKKYIIPALLVVVIAGVFVIFKKDNTAVVDILGVKISYPKEFYTSKDSEVYAGRADVDFSTNDGAIISNVKHDFIYSSGIDRRAFKDGELGIQIEVTRYAKDITLNEITPKFSEAFDKPLISTPTKIGSYDAVLIENSYYIAKGNKSVVLKVNKNKITSDLEKKLNDILKSIKI